MSLELSAEQLLENWNKLISIAKGEYIWLLHHDEFWQKEKNIINYIFEIIKIKNPNILILPISISKIIKINNININITHKHITLKKIYRNYICNPKLLLKLNIIGSPSSIIYKRIKLDYDKNFKYLVDVEFYFRLFTYFNSKNIIRGNKFYNLLSLQNNNNSITSLLKKEIRILKNKESIFIFRKYKLKFNFYENILSLHSYFILKLYSLITTKINIYKR